MEEKHTREVLRNVRIGIQEVYLCSEFALKYLEKGPDRDAHLENMGSLVKNYCLLDRRMQVRPAVLSKMDAEETEKLAQRENADNRKNPENPEPVDTSIPNYHEILSSRIDNIIKKSNIENHEKFKDFKKKIEKLKHLTDGGGDDDDLVVTDESNNLIDPLSKTELVDPVISIRCKHRFSRKTVTEHLKGKYASQCPYVGCKEKFNADDLEDDVIAAQTLRRMQQRRQI